MNGKNPAKKEIAIVWQKCAGNSNIAQRFRVPGFEGRLPFLFSEEKYNSVINKDNVELIEKDLLFGILYVLSGVSDPFGRPINAREKSTYLYLLDGFCGGFGFSDPEQMILNTAVTAREELGANVSVRILSSGNMLIPESSKIKSDLVVDIWDCASRYDDYGGLSKISSLLKEIDFSAILPGPKEVICYYGLCVLVFLKKGKEIDGFLNDYIYPNVEHPYLKNKIVNLLENPQSFNFTDLTIQTQ